MGPVWMVAGVELRRRWRALLGLSLLVGFVSASIFTALVGAERTSTSIDRLRTWSAASDASYQSDNPAQGDAVLAAVRDIPDVEAACERFLVNAFVVDGRVPDIAIVTDPQAKCGTEIDRPHLLAGRVPDPGAPDEIMLNELAARLTGLKVGDRLVVNTWSVADLDALFTGRDFAGFNGPQLDLRVVGIGRVLEELPGEIQRTSPYAIASASFLPGHSDLGAWPPLVFVRVRGGDEGLAKVSAALGPILFDAGVAAGPGGSYSPGSTARAEYLDSSRRSVNSTAIGLLIFATGAATAGALMLGLSLIRHLGASSASASTLGQLGLTRLQIAMALTIPVAIAAIVGSLIGLAGAIVASPLLPVGLARRAEVSPGITVRPEILIPGAIIVVVALASFAFVKAVGLNTLLRRGALLSQRTPLVLRMARQLGVPPTIDVGVGFATDRRRGKHARPLRSAFAGLAVGIAGIAVAGAIGSSFDAVSSQPASWGWNWSSMPDYFGDGDIPSLEAKLVQDDRLAGVGHLIQGTVIIKGRATTAYAMESLSGALSLRGRSGRLPESPGEVALTDTTMRTLKLSVGDPIEILANDTTTLRTATVVGTVVLPPGGGDSAGAGAVFNLEGLTAFAQRNELTSSVVLQYPPNAEAAALEASLVKDYGFNFNLFTSPQPPGSVRNVAASNDSAVALAWFFAILGAFGLLHALVATTQRSAHDNAVLRALGFRPSQVRGATLTQSIVLGAAALLVGVPTGLVTGRFAWHLIVRNTEAIAPPATPWATVALLVPSTLIIVALLSWWPGRSAARRSPGRDLRSV